MKLIVIVPLLMLFTGCLSDLTVNFSSQDVINEVAFVTYFTQCSRSKAVNQDGVLTGSQFMDCMLPAYNLSMREKLK